MLTGALQPSGYHQKPLILKNKLKNTLTVGVAQIAPVWLDRDATGAKIVDWIREAASQDCELVVFGEALLPGYPFWVERTDGARFESELQKDLYRHYVEQSVCIEAGDLDGICSAARDNAIAVYVGIMERAGDRGGHSLYASLVYIDARGEIGSVHRKLMPTHEERLVWAIGDGHGLRTHRVGPFTVGGLNCWENWLPLARAALHAQGEDLHIGLWPGNRHNTEELTRFAAREGRSYVLSVCGLMSREHVSDLAPHADELRRALPEVSGDGGSCIAGPDGEFVVPPVCGREELIVAELDHAFVRRERQNFDISGHYARPELIHIELDHRRHRGLWPKSD